MGASLVGCSADVRRSVESEFNGVYYSIRSNGEMIRGELSEDELKYRMGEIDVRIKGDRLLINGVDYGRLQKEDHLLVTSEGYIAVNGMRRVPVVQ